MNNQAALGFNKEAASQNRTGGLIQDFTNLIPESNSEYDGDDTNDNNNNNPTKFNFEGANLHKFILPPEDTCFSNKKETRINTGFFVPKEGLEPSLPCEN